METNYDKSDNVEEQVEYMSWKNSHQRGKIISGLLIVIFGSLYLMHEIGFAIPHWVLSWKMILIGLGFALTIKHKFKKLSPYILMLVGGVFLLKDFYPLLVNVRLVFPIIIIAVGIGMIFKSKRGPKHKNHRFKKKEFEKFNYQEFDDLSKDDFIDSVNFFGGIKKNVVSKNFKGADIVTVFGGSKIDLSQADFEDKAILDLTSVFGGMSLIMPPNWQIKSELVTLFGSIEDKRQAQASLDGIDKVIVLRGTCIFSGVEIKSK